MDKNLDENCNENALANSDELGTPQKTKDDVENEASKTEAVDNNDNKTVVTTISSHVVEGDSDDSDPDGKSEDWVGLDSAFKKTPKSGNISSENESPNKMKMIESSTTNEAEKSDTPNEKEGVSDENKSNEVCDKEGETGEVKDRETLVEVNSSTEDSTSDDDEKEPIPISKDKEKEDRAKRKRESSAEDLPNEKESKIDSTCDNENEKNSDSANNTNSAQEEETSIGESAELSTSDSQKDEVKENLPKEGEEKKSDDTTKDEDEIKHGTTVGDGDGNEKPMETETPEETNNSSEIVDETIKDEDIITDIDTSEPSPSKYTASESEDEPSKQAKQMESYLEAQINNAGDDEAKIEEPEGLKLDNVFELGGNDPEISDQLAKLINNSLKEDRIIARKEAEEEEVIKEKLHNICGIWGI